MLPRAAESHVAGCMRPADRKLLTHGLGIHGSVVDTRIGWGYTDTFNGYTDRELFMPAMDKLSVVGMQRVARGDMRRHDQRSNQQKAGGIIYANNLQENRTMRE